MWGGRAAVRRRPSWTTIRPSQTRSPQPPPASLVMMSPNGDQALAMVGMDIYTVAVPQVGATPATVSVANPASAAVPVKKLNEIGGEFPIWTADGRKVMWSLANAVWTYDLDRAKVVEDSLKADARVKAAARRDSIAAAAAAAAPTAAGAAPTPPTLHAQEGRSRATSPPSSASSSPRRATRRRGAIVLRGGRAITMKGNEIIENADVVVQDNRIVAVGTRGAVPSRPAPRSSTSPASRSCPASSIRTITRSGSTPNIHNNQTWQYLTSSLMARRRRATRRRRPPTSCRTATASRRATWSARASTRRARASSAASRSATSTTRARSSSATRSTTIRKRSRCT